MSTFSNYTTSLFYNDFLFLIPELFFLFSLIFGFFFILICSTQYGAFWDSRVSYWFCFFLLTFFCALCCSRPVKTFSVFYNSIVYSPYTFYIISMGLGIFLFTWLVLHSYFQIIHFSFEFFFLVLCSFWGLYCLIISSDFLTFFISLEIFSLPAYVLAVSKQYAYLSSEAALKYLVLGSFSSSLILLGLSLIYLVSGVSSFSDLFSFILLYSSSSHSESFLYYIFFLGWLFFFSGLCFKIGVVPFHMWLPDIYSGISYPVLLFYSIVTKFFLLLLLVRLVYVFGAFLPLYFNFFFLFLGISSLIVGTFGAIYQIKIKRLFAYSSFSNVSFFFACFYFINFSSLFAVLISIFLYCFIMIGILGFFSSFYNFSLGKFVSSIYSFSGLFHHNKLLSFIIFFLLMSIAGVPPLAGFFGKYFVLWVMLFDGQIILALIFLLFTVISAFYYFRLIKLVFFESNQDCKYFFKPLSSITGYVLFFNLFFTIFFILVFDFITSYFFLLTLNFFL